MPRIETHHARVPWSWVGWMTAPWLAHFYLENVTGGGPLTFTIRQYVESPVLIGFLSSIGIGFGLVVGVVISYLSDRVWTPWGRRRPFLLVGWMGAAVALALVPLAGNLTTLVIAVVAMQLFTSIARPLEPLYNEVVPPPQRGRAATVRNIGQQVLNLAFFGVLLAQFDARYTFDVFGRPFALRGDLVIYWIGSAVLALVVVFMAVGVRETPRHEPVGDRRFRPRAFIRDVFGQRQWWMVYLLYSTPIIAGPTGGSFGFLMQTEQLGFSKAQVGWSISIGTIAMIVLVAPLVGYLADRTSRMRLLRIGLVAPAVLELGFYLYLRFVADHTIGFGTLVGVGITSSALRTCAFLVWSPLVFDYVPTDRFGTVSAGLAFVGSIAPVLIINLSGFWISGFTDLFGAPGGSAYDYSSLYVLQVLCTAVAYAATVVFVREERAGRILPLGRRELAARPG